MSDLRKKIVLIEDDLDVREMLTRSLMGLGYDVWAAGDGDVGIALVEEHTPDLVCLDISLPHISGFDVCEALRANADTREVPILVVTARMAPQDRALAEMLGADGYLTKPFSFETFKRVVERLLHYGQESSETIALPVSQTE